MVAIALRWAINIPQLGDVVPCLRSGIKPVHKSLVYDGGRLL
jgi:hypothetical protein